MEELDTFPWSGHAALVGVKERPWQGREYVLQIFSPNARRAQEAYHAYVESALLQGRREDHIF
ncbi:MAG: hypothetical protein KA801_14870 [Syntrophorhabdaceae bacterium]|nr:hypothetical protein [Syntrophorhabdaceae bacterium]